MAPGQPTSFRLTAEAKRLVEELEKLLGVKKSAVIELAVRALHKSTIGDRPKRKKPPE